MSTGQTALSHTEKTRTIFNKVLEGSATPDEFYTDLWSKLVYFKTPERNVFIEKAALFPEKDEVDHGKYLLLLGMSRIFDSAYDKTFEPLHKTIEIFTRNNCHGGLVAAGTLLGLSYRSIGRLDEAEKYIQVTLKSIPFVEREDVFRYFCCLGYYQAGELNTQLKNYQSALGYFEKGRIYVGEMPHADFEGRLLSGIGTVLMNTEDWPKAIEYFEKALKIIQVAQNQLLISKLHADIGNYHLKNGDLKQSLKNQETSLQIRLENNFINPAITNYTALAEIHFQMNDFRKAIEYGEKAVEEAQKLKVMMKLYEAHEILSRAYEKIEDISKAYDNFKKFHKYQSEVINQESIKKIEQLQSQHHMEKMNHEKEIIHLRNVELKAAMDEIHESIRYAKRIQNAILPSDSIVNKYLPESFIFYQPKDIVAGDFYFLEISGNHVIFAACDCTGHGVPGALVSVVCSNSLNRSIHEFGITEPGKILDKTREIVISEFEKSDEEVKDGMDISILNFEILNDVISKISWAGANNPLWIIRHKQLIEYKGNKQPVGKFLKNEHFTTESIKIQKGDCLYLFSDGISDQFGGEKGKKFTSKKLGDFLISISDKPLIEQKTLLQNCFSDWQGNHEQVDDVLMIGIRV